MIPETPTKDELSEAEMDAVTMVFRQYETGLREAAINAKVNIKFLVDEQLGIYSFACTSLLPRIVLGPSNWRNR